MTRDLYPLDERSVEELAEKVLALALLLDGSAAKDAALVRAAREYQACATPETWKRREGT